jgi:hypothetical protein
MAEHIPANMRRLKVVYPAQHWDCPSHGSQRYEHQVDDDGNVFVLVLVEAVKPLLSAGYQIDPS